MKRDYPLGGLNVRKLNDRIDRFCILHPNFGIPNLMRYIVIGNVIMFLAMAMDMYDVSWRVWELLRFSPEQIYHHWQLWRLVTFVFIPDSSGFWIIFYLYLYYFIGNELESTWGTGKFTIYYFSGVFLTALYGTIIWLITGYDIPVTVQFVNLSMFLAFATLYPDTQFVIFFFIPVKAKWLAWIDAALFAINVVFNSFPMNLLPVVAVLNYFVFCGEWLWDLVAGGRRQRQKNVVNFRREARRIKRESKDRPYNRKCEVCGRTDADYPDLEFRFCSRCTGYHCYCADHINDHVHHVD